MKTASVTHSSHECLMFFRLTLMGYTDGGKYNCTKISEILVYVSVCRTMFDIWFFKYDFTLGAFKVFLLSSWHMYVMQGNLKIHLSCIFLPMPFYKHLLYSVGSTKEEDIDKKIPVIWHKEVDFQWFGLDVMGAMRKAALVSLWSCLRFFRRSNQGTTDCLPAWHGLPKTWVVIAKFPVFPVMADEDILQKFQRPQGGGRQMMPSNQIHENISGFTVYAESLYFSPGSWWLRLNSLNSFTSFP